MPHTPPEVNDPLYFAIFPRETDSILFDGDRILLSGEQGSMRKMMRLFRGRNVFIRNPDGTEEFPERDEPVALTKQDPPAPSEGTARLFGVLTIRYYNCPICQGQFVQPPEGYTGACPRCKRGIRE